MRRAQNAISPTARARRLRQQVAGDQEPGDHEEDVDAHEAAVEPGQPHVVADDQHDGDGPEPLEVTAAIRRGRGRRRPADVSRAPRRYVPSKCLALR